MVAFKVIDNRASISKKIKGMEQDLENFAQNFLIEFAQEVILFSPVDTGTYITSHRMGKGQAGGSTTSEGKLRGRDFEPFAEEGLGILMSNISGLDTKTLNSVTVSNIALHAPEVEYDHGYAPYGTVRSRLGAIAANAAAKTG